MRLLTPMLAACVVAAIPASAGTPSAPAMPRPVPAVSVDFAMQKTDFEARARHDMDLWQRRMDEASAKGQVELDHAWTATREQWAALQQATAETWDRSRLAYEHAIERLKQEWHKYQPSNE